MNFIIFPYFYQKTIILHAFEHILHNKKNFYKNRDSFPLENEFSLISIILSNVIIQAFKHIFHLKTTFTKVGIPIPWKWMLSYFHIFTKRLIHAFEHIFHLKNNFYKKLSPPSILNISFIIFSYFHCNTIINAF